VLRRLPAEHARQRHRSPLPRRGHHHRIGHDPAQLGNTFPLDVAVWGNVRQTLAALNASWKESDARLPHLERRAAALRSRGAERVRQLHDEAMGHASDKPIHPNYLAQVAGRVLPEGTMVVSESFRNADHLMPFGFDKRQWRLVRTFGASLGHGIGAAVGAQLGAPDRPVVCSIGDGAVMYSASGFWTMARYGLPILTVVWNNLNYQTVRTNFHTFGGEMAKQKKYPEVYLGDPEIDFVMLAKAQGIEGTTGPRARGHRGRPAAGRRRHPRGRAVSARYPRGHRRHRRRLHLAPALQAARLEEPGRSRGPTWPSRQQSSKPRCRSPTWAATITMITRSPSPATRRKQTSA
jgi:thiamine pyrophosphate-dependent acetolactate synthase large subunit-like protein